MSELTTGAAMACDATVQKEKSIGRSWKKRPFPSKPKRRQWRSLRSDPHLWRKPHLLVAEVNNQLDGYAYGSPHRPRAAYRCSAGI